MLAFFFVCQALSAPAVVLTNNLSFALSFVRQATTATNLPETEKVERFRVSNKELIGVLGGVTTNAFPPGASLILIATNPALVFVTGKGGLVLADVSRFFSFEFSTNKVQQSKVASSQSTVRTSYSIVRVTFDDGQGNSFDISGAAIEQYHASALSSGSQKETGSVSLDAAGNGSSGARFSVVKGKMRLTGKDTVAASQ